MEIKYKNCKKCKLPKEINESNFYKHPTGKDGFKCICKNCISLKDYNKNHQGTITQFNNSRKKAIEFEDGTKLCIECKLIQSKENFLMDGSILAAKCKECQSYQRLYEKYKLTKIDYLVMFNNQNGKCNICKDKEITYNKLIVDHCHSTNIVRGLLCGDCNKGLGLFKDNIESLKRAAKYLEDFQNKL